MIAALNEDTPVEQENLEEISPQISESSHNHEIPCHDYDGYGGPAWLATDSYSTGDIVEYPSNSGNYYILSTANVTNQNGTDSPEHDLWSGPCTCSEIASSGNVPTWDFNITYAPWEIVEHNGSYWIAQELGALLDEEPGNEGASGSPEDYWKPCSSHCSTWANSADGMGGPVWQNGSVYYTNEIVEWPANSGQFWQMTFNGSNDPPEAVQDGDWIGPCTCTEIGIEGGITWDATMTYDPWQILEHSGSYWIAQGVGAPLGEEPGNEGASGASSDFWKQCSRLGPCSTFNGSAGPVWDSTASYSTNDTVEWPANSGEFWQSTTSGPTGEPNPNGKWIGPCTCKDIWADSTSSVWDSNTVYDAGMIVEFPAGSEDIWIAITPSTTAGVDPTYAWADGNEWKLCYSDDGGPCPGLEVVGVWDSTMNVTSGEIYEYPLGSGTLYQVNPGGPFWSVSAPDIDLDVWSPIDCPCEETWEANGQPVWDSTITYPINSVVEWPAGSLDLWIAIAPSTTAGVDPTYAWADGNEWELCSSDNSTDGGPCSGLEVVGVWDSSINVSSGEIYEYPSTSGIFYQVNPGGPFWSVSAPNIDLDVWSLIECPCKETWDANGQPVWDSSIVNYAGNYVVEWPANSGILYISEGGGLTGSGEPGVDTHWFPCEETPSDGGPCAGLDVVGVWDATMSVTSGEIYEYPANSGIFYQVNPGGPFSSVSAPYMDLDVWSPIDCPCEKTWINNGQPVWDSGIYYYSGNYVVEWPANSGILYISEGGGLTGAGEPGVDTHWFPCEETLSDGGPCAGLTVVGVWDSTLDGPNLTPGDIYEYPANMGIYYQVNSGGASSLSPDNDPVGWSPIDCPCKETWDANGQPVWDISNTGYSGNYVVEWPANSGILYISEGGGLTSSAGEPGVDTHWFPCEETPSDGGPCAGFDLAGVWDSSITNYTGNYVVEWPANSGILYISEGGGLTGAGEPGVDGHWIPCKVAEESVDVAEDSGSWMPSIGFVGTIVAITMGAFIANRRQLIL
jgi:hypothetical protein